MNPSQELKSIVDAVCAEHMALVKVKAMPLTLNEEVNVKWMLDGLAEDAIDMKVNLLAAMHMMLYGAHNLDWMTELEEGMGDVAQYQELVIQAKELNSMGEMMIELNRAFGSTRPDVTGRAFNETRNLLATNIQRCVSSQVSLQWRKRENSHAALLAEFESANGAAETLSQAQLTAQQMLNTIGINVPCS
jgi:post-segregation antitoxin (ccd killing protein)